MCIKIPLFDHIFLLFFTHYSEVIISKCQKYYAMWNNKVIIYFCIYFLIILVSEQLVSVLNEKYYRYLFKGDI